MKHKTEKKQKIPVIIIYSLVFYGVWALWELFGRSAAGRVVSDELMLEMITEGIINLNYSHQCLIIASTPEKH